MLSIFNRLRKLIDLVEMPQISTICSREEFSCILERELARAERSGQRFSVVEFDVRDIETNEANRELGKELLQVLAKGLRSTDEVGWLDSHHIGVLLHDTPPDGAKVFCERIHTLLPKVFTSSDCRIHTYPTGDQARDESSYQGVERRRTSQGSSFQDITQKKAPKPVQLMRMLYSRAMPPWKRLIDIFGSIVFLILFSPLLILAGIMIKVVSRGPVFFKQHRVGYGGKVFTLYKLRTMKVHADAAAHQQYLAELIRDAAGEKKTGKPMKKLDDPQIIPFVGKILRVTCIDELPQLINVLLGKMSFVGPRPPIPYEVEEYVTWYKGRFDAVPGMTGLWQVSGKNRLTFKDMARLDIRYARQMSFALDVKILLLTPLALFYEIKDHFGKNQPLVKGVDNA